MKNYFIVLTIALATGLSANCQGIKVPEAVKDAFTAKFPSANNVKWGKETANEFEAEFSINGNPVSANFGIDGSWVETESVIPVFELPVVVNTAISKKYPGASITLAEKTEKPGNKISYEVALKIDGKKKSMELNADGTVAH